MVYRYCVTGQAAAAKAEELGIGKEDQKLQFAQLLGMADGLSLGLKNAGFQVCKYVPFGPVEQVIPYLLRRAEENRGLLSSSTVDRQLIRKELMRRLATAVVGKT
ncbi:Proline dehydrogenase [Musa troglodytarum]|uniref:Proline dehydrogenase n=1 Tax=Musa troglodytarum TaxID=320322 RepID=A0A9E7FRL8_9LILI|nr:Proline dehydrogenase [Musa troglodytarum]